MIDREKVIRGLECCVKPGTESCMECPYSMMNAVEGWHCRDMRMEALALIRGQEARLMDKAEVAASPEGTVLWVEERQLVTQNIFPLEIFTVSTHPDSGTDYLFFITYYDIKKFECDEYNRVWRCWTSRPTDEQREETPWK